MRPQVLVPILAVALVSGCAPLSPNPTFIQPVTDPAEQAGPPSTDPAGQPQPAVDTTWGTAAPATAQATPQALAPVAPPPQAVGTLRVDLPPGFRSEAGWYINEQVEMSGGSRRVRRGLVRVLPAVPASSGSFNDVLRNHVKLYIPQELQSAMAGMTYRRYVGDGLVAQYLQGQGVENGRQGNSWFVTYLIDCGATWQPLIVAATYDENPSGAGFDMNIRFALPSAMDLVEPLLAAVRCEGPKNQAIVEPSLLAGHYYFGSGASMDYIHIYTGASSTQFVSYGGDYDLRADGTVTYKYSSAANVGAGTTFAGDGGTGTWAVDRDMLVIALKGRQVKYLRIAALQPFQDSRVAVLLDSAKLATPGNVGDAREYYSTKKK